MTWRGGSAVEAAVPRRDCRRRPQKAPLFYSRFILDPSKLRITRRWLCGASWRTSVYYYLGYIRTWVYFLCCLPLRGTSITTVAY